MTWIGHTNRKLPIGGGLRCIWIICCNTDQAIVTDSSALLNFIITALKQARKTESQKAAKAFFYLSSKANNKAVEMIQSFLNLDYHWSKGLETFSIKNGKIGQVPLNNRLYFSLSTLDILKRFSLFDNSEYQEILALGNRSFRSVRKKFSFSVNRIYQHNDEEVEEIKFAIQSNKNNETIKGTITIGLTTHNIYFYQLSCIVHKLLRPLQKQAKIGPTKINLSYQLLPEKHHFDLISFEFEYDYTFRKNKQHIITQGFVKPLQWGKQYFIFLNDNYFSNDYERILNTPFNPRFWGHTEYSVLCRKISGKILTI